MTQTAPRSVILGTGSAVPSTVVTNHDLARIVDTSDEWITTRTGIKERRVLEADQAASDLALRASERALEDAGLAVEDLDAIIVGTCTADYPFPSLACVLEAKLGAREVFSFDVNAACSGFLNALSVTDMFIRSGRIRNALVVGSDVLSRFLDWQDRSTCILFGDGAGAAVVEASAKPGIVASNLGADGKLADVITTAGRVNQGRVEGSGSFAMDGPLVYKVAVKVMAASARRACADAGLEPAALDWLVVHQANLRIINTLARELGIADDRVVRTVAKHANTSAASIPLALSTIWGRIAPGEHVLLVAAGGGLTWGSVLWRATARSGHR